MNALSGPGGCLAFLLVCHFLGSGFQQFHNVLHIRTAAEQSVLPGDFFAGDLKQKMDAVLLVAMRAVGTKLLLDVKYLRETDGIRGKTRDSTLGFITQCFPERERGLRQWATCKL